MKGYLLSILLLSLGLAGMSLIALHAGRAVSSDSKQNESQEDKTASLSRMSELRLEPMRERPSSGMRESDAGIPAQPNKTAMAGEQPNSEPASDGPPKQPGPAPVLVIQFDAESGRTSKDHYRAVRRLVDKVGYKDTEYLLTAFAAEMHRDTYNLELARKRCRRVARLIRKRGVSRRWIKCLDPVYRKQTSKPEAAHLAPAWRRVEIRVKK